MKLNRTFKNMKRKFMEGSEVEITQYYFQDQTNFNKYILNVLTLCQLLKWKIISKL